MIIYFSFGGTTRKYAEQLAALIKEPVYELKEEKNNNAIITIASNAFKSVFKMQSQAESLPTLSKDRIIYLCTPIYAGNIPPVVRYFIENSNLENKKINLVILCASISNSEKYKNNVIKNFVNKKCKIGFANVFTSNKNSIDDDIIADHLSEIVLNIDKSY